ncbi:MAG: hypothetical protein HOP15_16690, partial [Planctomycetes bacterium]|nr:hypothetical protein [Planctomycetota bacterium]
MRHRSVCRSFLLALGLFTAACSSGTGEEGDDGFQLTRISLLEGSVWKVNQEIVFTFSEPVDFSSVSLNTISIQTTLGTPATGSFFLRGVDRVVFQPSCPRNDLLTDSGLIAGGVPYVIRVAGRSSGAANTIRSTSGADLQVTQTRNFTTDAVNSAFLDTEPGGPLAIVRAQGTSGPTTYLELGGDPDDRVYFERDANQNLVFSVDGILVQQFLVPLNLYGDPATRVAVVIQFDQSISPSSGNVSSDVMRLEFFDNTAVWRPLETRVTLVANCTDTGARVRLDPVGILPQGSQIRAVVQGGIADIVGETTGPADTSFAVVDTQLVDFTSLTPSDDLSDQFAESFDFGSGSTLTFRDSALLSASPDASWGNGLLTAAFRFEGSGGPGGTFDWLVEDGDRIVLDTDQGFILGADGVTVQVVDDGRIDVRNMTIEAGGEVIVQGTQPLRVDATGDVIIRGLLDLSGANASDVIVPNRGGEVELGGAGGPGGGRGGNANEVRTNSTARGGVGQGPGSNTNPGGGGGESGFQVPTHLNLKEARRPGGGAGGRFAANGGANGGPGAAVANSAVTGQPRPNGGTVASGPFVDGGPGAALNNFFGTKAVATAGNVTSLIRGELPSLWGGYGGGGGGNANPADKFPTPNWTTS